MINCIFWFELAKIAYFAIDPNWNSNGTGELLETWEVGQMMGGN